MRFNVLAGLVALLPFAAFASGLSNPGKVSASNALSIVNSLNKAMMPHLQSINGTLAGVKASSSADQKSAAAKSVGSEFQAITIAIDVAVGQLGQKANNVQTRQDTGDVNALAAALKATLTSLLNVINTALSVLGLTPLLAFLTPLTGALSGLILSLEKVVDALLPLLNTVLDSVLTGISKVLTGIIL